jgi:hypothetical protein
MAVCAWCDREMTLASSCTVEAWHLRGERLVVARFGEEHRWRRPRPGQRCHDCGVAPDGFHHPGCDVAECPECEQQLLTCGCRFDEDDELGNPDFDPEHQP